MSLFNIYLKNYYYYFFLFDMSNERNLLLTFITWNVAANTPTASVIEQLKVLSADSPELIFFNIQELDEQEFATPYGVPKRFELWESAAEEAFKDRHQIYFTEECGAVGLIILKKIGSNLAVKQTDTQVNQFENAQRNKASIAVNLQLQLNSSSFNLSVIGNHLEAYQEMYDERNREWVFVDSCSGCGNYTVMMGDLNYRVDLPYEEAIEKANKNDYTSLLKHDQLKRAQTEFKQINQYEEAEIRFRPTYKYDLNSDIYDTSYKRRIPSFTDRILVKTMNGIPKPIFREYNRMESTFSDHRPVYLKMEIPIM